MRPRVPYKKIWKNSSFYQMKTKCSDCPYILIKQSCHWAKSYMLSSMNIGFLLGFGLSIRILYSSFNNVFESSVLILLFIWLFVRFESSAIVLTMRCTLHLVAVLSSLSLSEAIKHTHLFNPSRMFINAY